MSTTLGGMMRAAGAIGERWIWGGAEEATLEAVLSGIDRAGRRLRGRSVLIASESQFAAIRALVACDGVARRIVICPPRLPADHLAAIAADAGVDAVLCDDPSTGNPLPHIEALAIRLGESGSGAESASPAILSEVLEDRPATEWILLTSGTAGVPKMVVHTLRTLVGALAGSTLGINAVWSTFYDIRRYGGLQILLRALTGGGSIVLSSPSEPAPAFMARAGRHGVTHISGTPSHWRRALMAYTGEGFAPRYIRLSGEISDQAVLDRLRTSFPEASISHAFASTEAGVAFDVADGLAGFPADLIGQRGSVALRIGNGSLQIRSDRTALCYLGDDAAQLRDADGFVDTGDMVERRGDRYYFIGRRSGIINVGGFKIHPEEVEAVIAEHPRVRVCRVKARRNPITGSVVAADVVAAEGARDTPASPDRELEGEILAFCRARLAPHKMPASIRFVPALDIAASGKLGR